MQGLMWRATLAFAAVVTAQVDEPVEPLLPGWVAPQHWPSQGITKQAFRRDYGSAWDAVSAQIGGAHRTEEKEQKRAELHELVGATHRKTALPGSSVDRICPGRAMTPSPQTRTTGHWRRRTTRWPTTPTC